MAAREARTRVRDDATTPEPRSTRRLLGKLTLIGFAILVVVLFFSFHVERFMTLSSLHANEARLHDLFTVHPIANVCAYAAASFLWTIFSLPAATILMLLAGVLFGPWLGTAICVLAMSVGAVVSLLISRFLLRSFVQRRFAKQVQLIEREYERNGTSYLIAMRLTPILPYFVANAVFGLTPISAWRFFLISMIATIPIKFIYANAGSALADLHSMSDIFTWRFILAFVTLAALPFAGKFVTNRWLHARN